MASVPRPVLALILVFPTSAEYERHKADDESTRPEHKGSGDMEDVVWFKQTINNACGLYSILHAISNGMARSFIKTNTIMSKLLKQCMPLEPEPRALALEASEDLEHAYARVAMQGDSCVPENAEDDVDYHYVCFVKSHINGHLFEMDGDRKGPVDLGPLISGDEDLLCESALDVVRGFIEREQGSNLNFSLMALVLNV